ncbi:MAG: hypothetical protein U9P00_12635 [Pseudomonadota bacterium]|nr:hypothetical protein [Pseudomonadota bacterium]
MGDLRGVYGAGSDEALAALFQGTDHPPGGHYRLDGDETLEVGKG